MNDETRVALKNYDWLVKNRQAGIAWDSDTLVYGDGGCDVSELCEPGFTPATRDEK